ncbi:MAG: hypothetical protein KA807_16665 [Prolixibacteraceae bacterium]|jgi:DNA-directed RNA polymerase alpha subunit|nr:hypothetical protein [Prolixibacteraceae bacterium]
MNNFNQLILNLFQNSNELPYSHISISDLNYSVRTTNCLKKLGVNFLSELVTKSESELLKVPNLGMGCLEEIKENLSKMDLSLCSIDKEKIDQNQVIKKVCISDISISDLNFSVRTTNCLKKLGVNILSDLVIRSERELIKTRNFGRKSLQEIKDYLSRVGLNFKITNPDEHYLLRRFTFNNETEKTVKTILDPELYPILFIAIEELAFSQRTSNCLKTLKVTYIGDLVRKTETDLLKTKNFGRTSLREIKNKLDIINMQLNTDIDKWESDYIQDALNRLKNEIEIEQENIEKKFHNANQKISTLDEELFYLTSPVGNNKTRNRMMVMEYFGWNGNSPLTLESVGAKFNVSRERIRQVCAPVYKKWKSKNASARILENTLKLIKDSAPIQADKIESLITAKGISQKSISIDGIINAALITNRKIGFKTIDLNGEKIVVLNKQVKLTKFIIATAKKNMSKQGIVNVEDLLFKLNEYERDNNNRRLLLIVLNLIKGLHWLDAEKEWFWFSFIPRNRLINQIRKILSVSDATDVSELRTGVARHHRMEGFSPPRKVLLEFCRHIPWCLVNGNTISALPPLKSEDVLSDVEKLFYLILKEHGPVMKREELEKACLNAGMNNITFALYLSYSPIITKYAIGIYGLRGSKIPPGYIESLMMKRKPQQVLQDFGWMNEGKIWLALKLSKGTIKSGVFSVPSAMMQYLQGSYELRTADNDLIGRLLVKETRTWSLGPFIRRKGAEEGDYVVIVFDIHSRDAIIYIGDIDLLDDFSPS